MGAVAKQQDVVPAMDFTVIPGSVPQIAQCGGCGQMVQNFRRARRMHETWHAGIDAAPTGLEGSADGHLAEQSTRSGDTPI